MEVKIFAWFMHPNRFLFLAAQQKSRRERDKGKRRLTRNESRYHSGIFVSCKSGQLLFLTF